MEVHWEIGLKTQKTWLYRYLNKGSTSIASNLSCSWCSRVCSLFANEEREKGCLVTYLTLLPHIPAFFMTSLTGADSGIKNGSNKQHHCVVFSRLSNLDFLFFIFCLFANRTRNGITILLSDLFIYYFIYSIALPFHMARDGPLLCTKLRSHSFRR